MFYMYSVCVIIYANKDYYYKNENLTVHQRIFYFTLLSKITRF